MYEGVLFQRKDRERYGREGEEMYRKMKLKLNKEVLRKKEREGKDEKGRKMERKLEKKGDR